MKLLISLLVVAALSACASKPIDLNRSVFQQHKVLAVNLNEGTSDITFEKSMAGGTGGAAAGGLIGALVGSAIDAGVNSGRAEKFEELSLALGDYQPNVVLKQKLVENLNGIAFSAPIEINIGAVKRKDRKKLVPILTPSYVMSANYSVMNVTLTSDLKQFNQSDKNYLRHYSSQQPVSDDGIEVDADSNRQFWIDNPEILISKVEAGIDDVITQLVDDFNGVDLAESESDPIVNSESEVETAVSE